MTQNACVFKYWKWNIFWKSLLTSNYKHLFVLLTQNLTVLFEFYIGEVKFVHLLHLQYILWINQKNVKKKQNLFIVQYKNDKIYLKFFGRWYQCLNLKVITFIKRKYQVEIFNLQCSSTLSKIKKKSFKILHYVFTHCLVYIYLL